MEANDKKVVNKEVGKEMNTKDFVHILSITLSIIAIILSVIAIRTSVCSNKGCRMQEMPRCMYGQCWQYDGQRGSQRQFRGNNQQNRYWKYNQNGKGYGNNMPQWSNPWSNNSKKRNDNNAPKTDDQNIFPNSNAGIPMMPQ